MLNLLQFLQEVLRDYAKRFWIFWIVLYGATVLLELSRQVFLESLSPATLFNLASPQLAGTLLINEILGKPYLVLPILAMFLFNAWGFGSLFYSFSGVNPWEAVRSGLKNLHRYAGFIIVACLITLLGFTLLPGLAVGFIDTFTDLPLYLADGETLNTWLALPLILILGIPGIFLLVAFSNAPFILLLERKGMFQSLRESVRRVTPHWFMAAIYLLTSLIIAGIAYYLLSWLIFSLKLVLISDLSLRGESMLRIFLYSIPWVVVAIFYDLALYHLYKRVARATTEQNFSETQTQSNYPQNNQRRNPFSFFSWLPSQKSIAVFVLIAFIAVFVLFPAPAQAGSPFKGAFGWFVRTVVTTILAIAVCVGSGGTLCIPAFIGWALLIGSVVLTTGLEYMDSAACKGSYDPLFGTCSTNRDEATQEIRCSLSAKFTKVIFPDIPTPSEFAANPKASAPVTFNWNADAQPGLVNYFSIIDTKTNEILNPNCTGALGNQCSAGPVTTTCNLPYEKEYTAQIWAASCFQVGAKSVTPTCSGCGGDVSCVNYKLKTSSLPLPRVDIKADGKDGNVAFKAGTPIKLSWTSEYALSCTAQGGWSGDKATIESQTVTPQTGNEVYTLVCKRGDKSGSDSVSSAPATKQIQIFDSKGGGSGGGVGNLHIDSFNITNPLNPGDTVTVSWSVSGAKSCEVDNGIGKIPTVGSANITFLKTTTFTITCSDSDGNTVSAKRTVEVKKIPGVKEIKPE